MSVVLQDGFLTPHFRAVEMKCRCCGLLDRAKAIHLCEMLERVRTLFGPMTILSGSRCQQENDLVGGVRDSAHLDSMAADIVVNSDHDRFNLVRVASCCGFRRIGIAEHVVHLDTRDCTYPLMWTYYKERN